MARLGYSVVSRICCRPSAPMTDSPPPGEVVPSGTAGAGVGVSPASAPEPALAGHMPPPPTVVASAPESSMTWRSRGSSGAG